jgi:hypothetical protein
MQRTRAQWLSLDTEVNVDAKLFLGLLQDGYHDFWTVVDRENNVCHTGLESVTLTQENSP